MGMGPMTGRAAGYCAGYAAPGFTNPGFGFGRGGCGRGFGAGRGMRHGFYATGLPGWMRFGGAAPLPAAVAEPAVEDQARALRQQAEFLEQSLTAVKQRLADIEKTSA